MKKIVHFVIVLLAGASLYSCGSSKSIQHSASTSSSSKPETGRLERMMIVDENGSTQEVVVLQSEAVPLQLVDKVPTFQGQDLNAFSRWVNSQLVYPQEAKKNRIQGRVNLSFVIDVDGTISDIHVLSGDPLLATEAVRVVSSSPKWKPGKKGGSEVPVLVNFPIIFALR